MLTRERSTKLRYCRRQFFHCSAKLGNTLRTREVEVDARVNASFAEVPIVSTDLQIVLCEDFREASQERAQLRWRHREILGARPGPRRARKVGARAEARFANAPDRGLIGSIGDNRRADAFC